jgi:pimeloyl-ACP methyl ester carboxylesterase
MKTRLFVGTIFAISSALLLSACNESGAENGAGEKQSQNYIAIERQGVFASGGSVTEPIPGEFNAVENWLDFGRSGNTAHVDHANTFYQIPAGEKKSPMVYLHGYGQTRTGWQSTPDGREGWSDIFLKNGRAAFLVDQPRRGAAGATVNMVSNPQDTRNNGKEYNPGDQAWYTHFRIGRGTPNRYEGSQFPAGEEALNQFLRQMTPNTGEYDEALFGKSLSAVLADARRMSGKKVVCVTHSQGGRVGWATDTENMAAIVAVEPGFAPEVGSETYKKFVAAKIPMIFYFGDYIENGPADLKTTGFWQMVLNQVRDFAKHYNEDGGDATVIHLPEIGIHGNSHFMFQELNNKQIADHIEKWLESKGL